MILVIQIALGVAIAMGIVEWVRRWREKRQSLREAYERGQTFGREMREQIDAYLEQRFAPMKVRYLTAFAQRLASVYDEVDHEPEVVANVELGIFERNADAIVEMLAEETVDALSEWFEASDAVGARAGMVEDVRTKLASGVDGLKLDGMGLYVDKLAEIRQRRA